MRPAALLALSDRDLVEALSMLPDHELRDVCQHLVLDPILLPELVRRLVAVARRAS